jgi:HTH-type transcriptional repressor of NAD biosynthesis genes
MTFGKVGMYGGKFLPVHMGHVNMMIRASTMVDELHIVVSYDPKYEEILCSRGNKGAGIKRIPEDVRVRWWKQLTKDMPHVHVHKVYEEQTGQFEDWEKGATGIKEAVGKPIDVVFSSEPEYGVFFKRLYPGAAHVIVDPLRDKHSISATEIREEGPFKHWNMIPEVVKPYFNKTVVVVGTESCGKTTLVKNLANLYNTRYVEEYGRTFYERIGDENSTLYEDYSHIAFEQKFHEKNQLERANKILFVDTEAVVTQYYSQLYLSATNPVVEAVAEEQQYDLWLFLEPDVEWVGDGYRQHGDQSDRSKNNEKLKSMLTKKGVEFKSIKGNYQQRLEQAMLHVSKLLLSEGLT